MITNISLVSKHYPVTAMRFFTPTLFTLSICCAIILSVEDLYISEGETIKLRCLMGSKVEDITWLGPPDLTQYAVGYDINETFPFITVHNCDTCPNSGPYLEIRYSSDIMEGSYACYSKNNTQQMFHLKLKRKPANLKINTTTNDGKIIGKEGNELSIVCTVSRGQPGGNLSWSANGEILAVGGPDNVTYTLSPLRNQDNTTFTCTAYTSEGYVCLEDSVQLIMYYVPNVTITALPSKRVTEGDRLRLQLHHDSNAPDPKFVWSRNGTQLIETGLLLPLTKVHRNDTGEYMCTLISERGNGTAKISVIINYALDVHITQSKINNSYELKCNALGVPNNFTFYDWEHLSETGQHIRFIGGASETINVTSEHSYYNSGVYKCNVSNGILNSNGSLFQTATHTLKLEGKPFFLPSTKKKQYGIYGNNTTLDFDLYCYPMCTNVSLRQNGTSEDLPWDSLHGRYKVTNMFAVVKDSIYGSLVDVNATKIRITFVNIRAADFDNITVEVRNTNGSAWFDLALASASTPEPPYNLSAIPKLNTVKVIWKGAFDGGYQQTFVIQYTRFSKINDYEWITFTNITDDRLDIHTTRITGLDFDSQYVIGVYAYNEINRSQITTVTVKTESRPQFMIGLYTGCSVMAVILVVTAIVLVVHYKGKELQLLKRRVTSRFGLFSLKQDTNKRNGSQRIQLFNTTQGPSVLDRSWNVSLEEHYAMVKDSRIDGRHVPAFNSPSSHAGEIVIEEQYAEVIDTVLGNEDNRQENKTKHAPELTYTEIYFDPKAKDRNFRIRGLENRVPYADIDLNIKAEPLPDSESEEE